MHSCWLWRSDRLFEFFFRKKKTFLIILHGYHKAEKLVFYKNLIYGFIDKVDWWIVQCDKGDQLYYKLKEGDKKKNELFHHKLSIIQKRGLGVWYTSIHKIPHASSKSMLVLTIYPYNTNYHSFPFSFPSLVIAFFFFLKYTNDSLIYFWFLYLFDPIDGLQYDQSSYLIYLYIWTCDYGIMYLFNSIDWLTALLTWSFRTYGLDPVGLCTLSIPLVDSTTNDLPTQSLGA